jgi:hypothetical protein
MDMVDQTTLGHQFILKEFGVQPKVTWQIDPFGHSSTQAALLSAGAGFEALFFGRMDHQDHDNRMKTKNMVSRANFDSLPRVKFSYSGLTVVFCRLLLCSGVHLARQPELGTERSGVHWSFPKRKLWFVTSQLYAKILFSEFN